MAKPLYLLRKTLGITQAEMAAKLKVTPGRVSQIERHGGRLNDERLLTLFDTYRVELARLNLSVHDFLGQRPDRDEDERVASA